MNSQSLINQWLYQRIGLDVASIGVSAIERVVRQRQNSLQLNSSQDYWQYLQQSATEQQALIEAVVVPETWFFRYPESFVALTQLAIKQLNVLNRPLRLLSAPCATGEEPYSITMALFDAGLSAEQFTIDALDISPPLITRAQLGLYGKNSFRGEQLAYRQRHFQETSEGYQLSSKICQQVQFRTANLLNPSTLNSEQCYDFVFCRNVLIYFDVPTQEAVLKNLLNLKHKTGFLFVGPAEASLLSRHGLQAVAMPLSFAFQQNSSVVKVASQPTTVIKPVVKTSTPPVIKPKITTTNSKTTPSKTMPKLAEVNNDFSEISRLANAGRVSEAISICQQYLKQQKTSANLFYWLGLLHDSQGQSSQAADYYRKALYLDPQHQETLVHLAMLLTTQGDVAGAKRLQARISKGGKHGRTSA